MVICKSLFFFSRCFLYFFVLCLLFLEAFPFLASRESLFLVTSLVHCWRRLLPVGAVLAKVSIGVNGESLKWKTPKLFCLMILRS